MINDIASMDAKYNIYYSCAAWMEPNTIKYRYEQIINSNVRYVFWLRNHDLFLFHELHPWILFYIYAAIFLFPLFPFTWIYIVFYHIYKKNNTWNNIVHYCITTLNILIIIYICSLSLIHMHMYKTNYNYENSKSMKL